MQHIVGRILIVIGVITPDASVYCSGIEIVQYKESSHPIMKNAYGPAVLMTFRSSNPNFYIIDCQCSEDYAAETVSEKYKYIAVLVDPSSGKLIDIYTPNYYYSCYCSLHSSNLCTEIAKTAISRIAVSGFYEKTA